LKESFQALIYDMDNDDNNIVISMKNSIIGDEMMRSFVRALNEQARGKENFKLKKLLKNFSSSGNKDLQNNKNLSLLQFCDKLIRTIKNLKLEISTILPNKQKIVKTIFDIHTWLNSIALSSNIIRFFALCEAFLWAQYIYNKIMKAQLKRTANVPKISNLITSLFEAASHFSRDDHTGHLSKLCSFLQPLVANLSHNLI
jgi:hypothetical protein